MYIQALVPCVMSMRRFSRLSTETMVASCSPISQASVRKKKSRLPCRRSHVFEMKSASPTTTSRVS